MPLGFTRIIPSFGGERPSGARQPPTPTSSAPAASQRQTLGGKGVIGGGKEKHGLGGKGLGKGGLKRHRKIIRDSVRGITKGDIRRIARRGGVKRISATIYDEVREAMKNKIHMILHDCTAFVQHANRKSEHGESIRPSMDRDADLYVPQSAVTVSDVIFALKRQGRPIYGFDPK